MSSPDSSVVRWASMVVMILLATIVAVVISQRNHNFQKHRIDAVEGRVDENSRRLDDLEQ